MTLILTENFSAALGSSTRSESTQAIARSLPVWLTTGLVMTAMPTSTADPAATMWQRLTPIGTTPVCLVSPVAIITHARPERHALADGRGLAEDLGQGQVEHEELAAWARSMMGGDASDMLDT